ncbi:MAG: tetratricopeptide repeat protein [Nannocystaceae bacterium]
MSKAKSSRRRLASPTMAQIYMRQGHYHRARETLDAVLQSDPTAGAALVLRERLDLLDGPTIRGRAVPSDAKHGGALELRWTGAGTRSGGSDTHALVVVFQGRGVYVTSRRCDASDGEARIDLPRRGEPTGAASVALVRLAADGEATPLAVAEAITWG